MPEENWDEQLQLIESQRKVPGQIPVEEIQDLYDRVVESLENGHRSNASAIKGKIERKYGHLIQICPL